METYSDIRDYEELFSSDVRVEQLRPWRKHHNGFVAKKFVGARVKTVKGDFTGIVDTHDSHELALLDTRGRRVTLNTAHIVAMTNVIIVIRSLTVPPGTYSHAPDGTVAVEHRSSVYDNEFAEFEILDLPEAQDVRDYNWTEFRPIDKTSEE